MKATILSPWTKTKLPEVTFYERRNFFTQSVVVILCLLDDATDTVTWMSWYNLVELQHTLPLDTEVNLMRAIDQYLINDDVFLF